MKNESEKPKSRLRAFFGILGPGLVTGAADDDPSGIATYSIAGAQLGTSLLWTAWFTWPLMAFVQMMCARIGMVTGRGLAGALREKFPKPVLVVACVALLAANSINVGSDLSGMADAAELLTGVSSHIYVVLFGVGISYAIIRFRYQQIANVLKWLALVLCAYIIAAFLLKPDWGLVARAFIFPEIRGTEAWATIVAILGTTISPYLFFWQASQEVEEEKAIGRRTVVARRGATEREIKHRMLDVGVGTLLSNVVMFFIILTTALTLNAHGLSNISTSREAAEALRPLAGDLAMLLYTVGVIGVGLLAIPTLTGSAAYAFSETFRWRGGLDEKWKHAPAFYGVISLSALIGVAMDFLGINPVAALFWTAVINGLLAPFLLIGVWMVARDRLIMRGQPSSLLSQIVVLVTVVVMFGAAIAMFIF
jgi:NRAMP (natural resistance-associated macrophage protein)-like metal ion transporter